MTRFHWRYEGFRPVKVGTFLLNHLVSENLLKQVKYHGGAILVNNILRYTNWLLHNNDLVTMILPPEKSNPNVRVSYRSVHVMFENSNFLVVYKPSGMPSVPSHKYDYDTLVNRVKGYFICRNYNNLKMHIVTRLDKDAQGLVLFAKNHFAHTILDLESKRKLITKKYLILANGRINIEHGEIDLPIKRDSQSWVKRTVSGDGKDSKTEFWLLGYLSHASFLKVKLYTGRTHQIRVHFNAIGHPVLGDWLYNPNVKSKSFNRLKLACYLLKFYDPFQLKWITCRYVPKLY